MSRLRIYRDGLPDWSENEPARARVTGYGTSVFHAVTFTAPVTRPATRKPDKLTGSELREHKRELRRGRREPVGPCRQHRYSRVERAGRLIDMLRCYRCGFERPG